MSPFDVVGVGLSVVDALAVADHLPHPDEVYPTVRSDMQGGGPVATALVALARLGSRATYLGAAGDDPLGDFMLADFRRYGVDTSLVVRPPGAHTMLSLIIADQSSGTRAILYDPIRQPDTDFPPAWQAAVVSARLLHLDGGNLPAALAAARAAREAGVPVSFDGGAGGLWDGMDELVPLVDSVVVARGFARAVTGHDDPLAAGPALLNGAARNAAEVVITDGERGCWRWGRGDDAPLHVPAYRVTVVDTTGAGDTFHGAYIYATLQGWAPLQRLQFASATAALKCTQIGGRRGIPSLAEVLRFLGWAVDENRTTQRRKDAETPQRTW